MTPATPWATTNLLLGILAAASVFQALLLAGIAVAAWRAYGRSLAALASARREVEPLAARVNDLASKVEGIAADVKDVTSVARRAAHLYGIGRGVRAAYNSFVKGRASQRDSKEE